MSKAALHGLDGNAWATSAGFAVAPDEVKSIVGALNGGLDVFYQNGVRVGGVKYTFLRADEKRSVYARKGSEAGCICVMTNKCLVIAVYEGGIQPGACATVVEKLGDYLLSVGF